MAFKSYRELSNINWGSENHQLTLDQINTGCLLRMADATEAMAKNHVQLLEDRDRYKRWYEELKEANNRSARRISALQGVITRMKNKQTQPDHNHNS